MADILRIRALTVQCIIGVYPDERSGPQPLEVDVSLAVDTARAGARGRIRDTVDYASVAAQMSFVLENGRFHMLETAAHVLARCLLLPRPGGASVASVRLRLEKPRALGGRGVPSLEIERRGAAQRYGQEHKPFGTIDVIHEGQQVGFYRLNIAPGREIPLHVHRTMREAEMVLSDGLLCQGEPALPLSIRSWPHGAPHIYQNPTDEPQSILCIDSPPFMEDDEIQVEGRPVAVRPDVRFARRSRP